MVSVINQNLKIFDILIKVVSSMLSDRSLYEHLQRFLHFLWQSNQMMLQIVALIEGMNYTTQKFIELSETSQHFCYTFVSGDD